jgi:hypothetical protein
LPTVRRDIEIQWHEVDRPREVLRMAVSGIKSIRGTYMVNREALWKFASLATSAQDFLVFHWARQ